MIKKYRHMRYTERIRRQRCACAFLLLILSGPALLAQGEVPITEIPLYSYTSEFRLPIVYHSAGAEGAPVSAGLEFFHYHGTKVHDDLHRDIYSEETIGPMSFIHLAASYQPNTDLRETNTGYSSVLEGARVILPGLAVGITARIIESQLERAGVKAGDFELGPMIALWPSPGLYFLESAAYKSVTLVGDSASARSLVQGNYFQWRHHVAYAVSEDASFTYAQDVGLRIGTDTARHINNYIERNYFVFSPNQYISIMPEVGVNLDYYTGAAKSVLTLPLGIGFQYFLRGAFVIIGEAEYDLQTMSGQPTSHFSFFGRVEYRP